MKKHIAKIQSIMNETPELYEIFHADTQFFKDSKKKDTKLQSYYLPFKSYPRCKIVVLPEPLPLNMKLTSALKKRTSIRSFKSSPLSLESIGTILHYSLGLKSRKRPYTSRTYAPSPGAFNSIEAYILSLNTVLSKGIYHYNKKLHALEILSQEPIPFDSLFSEKFAKKSSMIIILSATFERVITKYGNRGYRYLLMEAGHIGQNIQLTSTALKIGSCPLGGYYDDAINKLIHLFPRIESSIYSFSVGETV